MDDDNEDNDNEEHNDDDEAMEEDEDEDMPVFFKEQNDANAKDAKTPSKNPKSKVALIVRAKLNKVLTSTGLADKRARQCDQNDFLKLLLGMFFLPGFPSWTTSLTPLTAFHEEGIHFS